MNTIPFTQFMRPNGRKELVQFQCDDPSIVDKAQQILATGLRFECEELISGMCSFTISSAEEDLAYSMVMNGPGVPDAVKKLINDFILPS
jgi:hypothetical protein